MVNRIDLEEGELVDTYGGDYTFKDSWAEYEDGKWVFYVSYYGAKAEPTYIVHDPEEKQDLLNLLKSHPEYHE